MPAIPPALVLGMLAASAAISLIYMLYTGHGTRTLEEIQAEQEVIEQVMPAPAPPDPLNSIQSP